MLKNWRRCDNMTDEYLNQIRIGSTFPSSSSAALCFKKTSPISKIELDHIKKQIMKYLETHKGAYISELAKIINVEPKKIVLAITELKKEGFLI